MWTYFHEFDIYSDRVTQLLTANGDYTLVGESVPEGTMLELQHLSCYGNVAAAGEYILLGFRRGGLDHYLMSEAETLAAPEVVKLNSTIWLIEGDAPIVRFVAGNDAELLVMNANGKLWHTKK